jgi:hypothetical protein
MGQYIMTGLEANQINIRAQHGKKCKILYNNKEKSVI